ncbi:hypothetical protein KF707_06965 [Candidatus Obscuribacterales bacterium]|nr:hypothetical protein [Candidatus Obscuribacterales bacterium]
MTTEVVDHGQIKRLLLPAGWTETATTGSDNHEQSLREFSPQDSEDTRLCFYYRGFPYELPTGAAFKAVLEAPPHSLPAKEIKSIAGMLEEICQPDSFKPLAIHTQVTGGRTLLVVEGRWLRQEWDTYSLYIAADDSGCVVQQIYFLAPTSSYPKYVKEIKECLRNIEWT